MRTTDLIREIQQLPIQQRKFVIEKSIYSLRKQEDTNTMKKAADSLYADYK